MSSTASAHYIYLTPHDPPRADEDAPRSLFLVNIPVTTTQAHLRHLFTNQLSGGRVERIEFPSNDAVNAKRRPVVSSKKRKRTTATAEEIESGLDNYALPNEYDLDLHPTGSSAVVVFVDRAAMELSLKLAQRAVKDKKEIVWGEGMSRKQQSQSVGLHRYQRHQELIFPGRKDLLRVVDGFMTTYTRMEEAQSRENAKRRAEPDEEGFITVTRGSKGGLRAEEAKEIGEREKAKLKKKKTENVGDFYRFQMRERKKEEQERLLHEFERDRERVRDMREKRLRPEVSRD